MNNKDQLDAEWKLMTSHLIQHDLKQKEKTNKHRTLGQELVKKVGSTCYKILLKHESSWLPREILFSFKTKNKKTLCVKTIAMICSSLASPQYNTFNTFGGLFITQSNIMTELLLQK